MYSTEFDQVLVFKCNVIFDVQYIKSILQIGKLIVETYKK
jgi:hypothetical protein